MIGIECLTEEQIVSAAALEARCFSDGVSADALQGFAKAEANHYYAATEGGTLCGYGGFSLAADEAEILSVAVAPEFRRRGIARSLMERMIRDAVQNGASVMYLDVRSSNEAAQCLYESLGFQRTGVRKGYYTKPREDAVLMMRSLTGQNLND